MKKSVFLKILSLMLAMLMVLSMVVACDGDKKSKDKDKENESTVLPTTADGIARAALEGFFTDLFARQELDYFFGMLTEGSLGISATGKNGAPSELFGKISGKMYFSFADEKPGFMIDDATWEYDETKISADLYMGQDMIYLSNDNILGGTYGIIMGNLSNDFENSIFATDDDFHLRDDFRQMISVYLEYLESGKGAEYTEKLQKLAEKYLNLLLDTFFENVEYEMVNETVTSGTSSFEGRAITVKITPATLNAVITTLLDTIKADTELRDFMLNYIVEVKNLAGDMGVNIGDIGDENAAYDEMIDMIEEAKVEWDEFYASGTEEEKNTSVDIKLVTPKDSVVLSQLSFYDHTDIDSTGDEDPLFTLDLGEKGIKETERIAVSVSNSTLEVLIKQTESNYDLSVRLTDKYRSEDLFSLKLNNQNHTCVCTLPTEDWTLSGTYTANGDAVTISLNKVEMYGEVTDDFVVTLNMKKKDTMPTPLGKDKVKNILKVTKGELVDIIDRAETVFEPFFASPDEEPYDPYNPYDPYDPYNPNYNNGFYY